MKNVGVPVVKNALLLLVSNLECDMSCSLML